MARWLASSLLVLCLLVSGCAALGGNGGNPDTTAPAAVTPTAAARPASTIAASDRLVGLPRLNGTATVEMTLASGTVTLEVDGINAPLTAGNFIDLVDRGFYNGLTFHRVVKDPTPFVVQGGDPQGTGMGGFVDPASGQERTIPLEIWAQGADKPSYSQVLPPTSKPKLRHERGVLAMARSQFPDSASSQFYITLADVFFLDGSYAVFGKVTQGMGLVDGIKVGDRIVSMRVVSGLDKLQRRA